MDFEPDIDSPFRKYGAPCPICKNHINRGETECYHCGYELSVYDIRLLKQYIRKQRNYGKWLGVKVIPMAIVLFTLFFLLLE
jgi:hypothetical protein